MDKSAHDELDIIETHDGDILIFEVRENIPSAQVEAFRRHLNERGRALGWDDRGILALVVQAGTLEVTRLTTDRIRALEEEMAALKSRLEWAAMTGKLSLFT